MSLTEQLLDYAKQNGATSSDCMHIESETTELSVLNGKTDNAEQSASSAIGLRVIVNDQQATAHTSNLTEEGLKRLAVKTVEMAKAMPKAKFAYINEHFDTVEPNHSLELEGNETSIEELKDYALATEDAALKQTQILKSNSAWSAHSKSHITLTTSTGFHHHYQKAHTAFGCSVLAGTEENKEVGFKHTAARYKEDLKNPLFIGAEAVRKAHDKVGATSTNLGGVPVIFDKDIAGRLLAELLGAINGSNIVRGVSFLKDKKGVQLFQDSIQIIDNPHLPRAFGSRPFDAEGTATRPLHVVENGVLKSWLTDLRTSHLLGVENTGHASRGLSSLPEPSSSNFYLKDGTLSVKDLMSSITKGFYVTGLKGRGGELSSGDYSVGAHGFLIENGVITKPLHNMTLAGHLLDVFKSLTPANDSEFTSALVSPSIYVEGFKVAGS